MLNIRSWMTKVSTELLLLKHIDSIEAYSCAANGTLALTVSNASRLIVFGIGGGNSKIVALVNSSASGEVTNLKVAGATNMTLTNATNKVTISNGYGYSMSVLVVGFKVNA